MLSWSSNTLTTWCKKLTHWKRPWCWERLRAGGEGYNRGWDGEGQRNLSCYIPCGHRVIHDEQLNNSAYRSQWLDWVEGARTGSVSSNPELPGDISVFLISTSPYTNLSWGGPKIWRSIFRNFHKLGSSRGFKLRTQMLVNGRPGLQDSFICSLKTAWPWEDCFITVFLSYKTGCV